MALKSSTFVNHNLGLAITFCMAALFMTYLSYALPHFLPGDFVTATYAASQVTLTAEQETALRAFYGRDDGFGHYLVRVARLDWGYSYAFQTPVSALFFQALPWTLLLMGSIRVINIPDGHANHIRGKPMDNTGQCVNIAQWINIAQGIYIRNPHLMMGPNSIGHMIKTQRVYRIGCRQRIG